MAPRRGWCKLCQDDYKPGDAIVKCVSCPKSYHQECLENDLTTTGLLNSESVGQIDLSDFQCENCLRYEDENVIENDERCKLCKEKNRDDRDVLLLCDGCPNSYHISCLQLVDEPDGEQWFCPMCKPEDFQVITFRKKQNPLDETGDHVNSSICYVCQRHGKLLGCDFCSNSFHHGCLPEFDAGTIGDVWECPCCKGQDPFLNQMHKRWTVHQIDKNLKERRRCVQLWKSKITKYRNRFLIAHRNDLGPFVTDRCMESLTRNFIDEGSATRRRLSHAARNIEELLEYFEEEAAVEAEKFIAKAHKSAYYPSGRRIEGRPLRAGVQLKPHQEFGVDWLLKSFLTGGAILSDEMGLGKTIQTLCFLSYLKLMKIDGPHLIVVPLSTVGNWLREVHRFTPHLTCIKICGSKTERLHAMEDRLSYKGLYDLYITTYETVKSEEEFFVETVPRWQCLILDEAHRIKNQSGAARHSMDRVLANMRLLLTGTPLQNNAMELFTLINFMFPDIFKDTTLMDEAFRHQPRKPGRTGPMSPAAVAAAAANVTFKKEDLEAIKMLLSRVMLRRLKEEAITLHPKVFHDVWLPLSKDSLHWYRTLMNVRSMVKEHVSVKKLLGMVIKMRIVCGHPRGIVSRAHQTEKLFDFFRQETLPIQSQIEEDACRLRDLRDQPHRDASAKLTFLDKLLCQLHYENCEFVPGYVSTFQNHLKELESIKEHKIKLRKKMKGVASLEPFVVETHEFLVRTHAPTARNPQFMVDGLYEKPVSNVCPYKRESFNFSLPRRRARVPPTEDGAGSDAGSMMAPKKGRIVEDDDIDEPTPDGAPVTTSEAGVEAPADGDMSGEAPVKTEAEVYDANSITLVKKEEVDTPAVETEASADEPTPVGDGLPVKNEAQPLDVKVELKQSILKVEPIAPDTTQQPQSAPPAPEESNSDFKTDMVDASTTEVSKDPVMHKVLIFTQFQLVLDELESYCNSRGWKYMRLDGSTNKLIRELDIREFNSPSSPYFIYLISTRAGGLGINLTAANHVVLYDEDWNPFIDLQAIDRAHRIGQKRSVHIWKLVSEWTVEERMALCREKKLHLDKLLINSNRQSMDYEEAAEVPIVSLTPAAILNMMMHGNNALKMTDGEDITGLYLDDIIARGRKKPPQGLDDAAEIDDSDDVTLLQDEVGPNMVNVSDIMREEDVFDSESGSVAGDVPEAPLLLEGTDLSVSDMLDHKQVKKLLSSTKDKAELLKRLETGGLLWRSGRERRRPPSMYVPDSFRKRTETRSIRHECRCFCCGFPKNHKASYKDKDGLTVELDYGELVPCFRCPKSYHRVCESLGPTKKTWTCRWHECCLCFRKSSQCDNMLIHCSNCPTSFCYDCFPPDYTRHYVGEDYYYALTQRGLNANASNWIFFLCSKCKILQEKDRRKKMTKEEREQQQRQQRELRKQLAASDIADDKEAKRRRREHRISYLDNHRSAEMTYENRIRGAYEALCPPNLIEEVTKRIEAARAKRDADEAAGIIRLRREVNFLAIRLPYRMLALCENCKLPLHNTARYPGECPYPKEYVKLEVLVPYEGAGGVSQGSEDGHADGASVAPGRVVPGRVIKKTACSKCLLALTGKLSHTRRSCDLLDEEEVHEYEDRRKRINMALDLLEKLGCKFPNDIDYSVISHARLKAIYATALEDMDRILLDCFTKCGVAVLPPATHINVAVAQAAPPSPPDMASAPVAAQPPATHTPDETSPINSSVTGPNSAPESPRGKRSNAAPAAEPVHKKLAALEPSRLPSPSTSALEGYINSPTVMNSRNTLAIPPLSLGGVAGADGINIAIPKLKHPAMADVMMPADHSQSSDGLRPAEVFSSVPAGSLTAGTSIPKRGASPPDGDIRDFFTDRNVAVGAQEGVEGVVPPVLAVVNLHVVNKLQRREHDNTGPREHGAKHGEERVELAENAVGVKSPDLEVRVIRPQGVDGVEGTDVVGVRVSTILVEGNEHLAAGFLDELLDVLGDLVSLPEVGAILRVFLVKNGAFDVVLVANFLNFESAARTTTGVVTPGKHEQAQLELVLGDVVGLPEYFEDGGHEEGLVVRELDGEEAVGALEPDPHNQKEEEDT
ncbi:SNF2 family N-terminal domain containing protein, putative [Babesia caballi]|uniref:SNF2 family N-terminal domain containing protein, putative n=1 Tax=Babesia caballi TaxID=5871 RepID=A0AAV4LPB5_BABCB|nr:SNF2 family N-terminal domain containing protein, putative [Babesia caballi]